MEEVVKNIRRLCPKQFKLATPGIITQIHHFGLTKQQFIQECTSTGEAILDTDTIALPTFFGDIINGHWYLAIVHHQHGITNEYVVDSIGYSQEQTTYVHNALSQVNVNIDEWTYFASIRQHELECGPRVIHNICDIIDQLQDEVHIKFVLGNLSKYNVTAGILLKQSRATMHEAIKNRLNADCLLNFVDEDDKPDGHGYQNNVPKTTSSAIAISKKTINCHDTTRSTSQSAIPKNLRIVD